MGRGQRKEKSNLAKHFEIEMSLKRPEIALNSPDF
jgi:hypothetical protein